MSDFNLPSFTIPRISSIPDPHAELIYENSAEDYVKRLVAIMNEYNDRLDHTRQVALRLVHFGQSMTINIANIGYWNPGIIIYYGTSIEGNPIELVQHVSQVSCLLTSVPREDPSKPKPPIGFATPLGAEISEE
jgi:hypothetical protein